MIGLDRGLQKSSPRSPTPTRRPLLPDQARCRRSAAKYQCSFRVVFCTLLAFSGSACGFAHAQGVPRESEQPQNDTLPTSSIAIEAGVLAIGASYARHFGASVAAGVGAGVGGAVGIMLLADEFSTGDYGPDHTFAELVHGDVFLRTFADRALQVEVGARVSWVYHPPSEYETVFVGIQAAPLLRAGPLRLGPRLLVGHMTEEAGRSRTNLGLIPIVIRYEWLW